MTSVSGTGSVTDSRSGMEIVDRDLKPGNWLVVEAWVGLHQGLTWAEMILADSRTI